MAARSNCNILASLTRHRMRPKHVYQGGRGNMSRDRAGVQIVMVIAQSALLWWKKRHKRSYEGVRWVHS